MSRAGGSPRSAPAPQEVLRWSGGAARQPFPVSPPTAIVRFACLTSRGPPQPGGDCRGGRDDSAGAGRGLREERGAGTRRGRSQVREGGQGGARCAEAPAVVGSAVPECP